MRRNRGCGRIERAGPSVSLPRHGLATMPGGMLGGPGFFKRLPPSSRFNGVLPRPESARKTARNPGENKTLLADLHQCTDGPFTTMFREIPARTRAREGRSWGFSQRPAREHRKTRSTFYGRWCMKAAEELTDGSPPVRVGGLRHPDTL